MRLRGKADKVQRAPLAAHPAFRAILIAWLAALAGLGTLVLTGHPIQAAAAAVVGAVGGWMVARVAAGNTGREVATARPEKVNDLDEEALATEPDRPAFINVSELGFAGIGSDMPVDEVEPCSAADHASNAGKREEPLAPQAGKGAATVLRSQPIDQMSLVQMIERFAHALDEHTEPRRREADGVAPKLPNAALIEALRTLPVVGPAPLRHYPTQGNLALAVSTSQQADETERALREALEKLQRMSGGA